MKKLTALLLALLMTLSMFACAQNPSDNDDVKDTGDDAQKQTEKEIEKETEKETEAEKTAELSRGHIDGDVYINDYLGFSFEKPASWVYSTDAEIAAAINLGVEEILDEKFKEALEKSGSIYDMMVTDVLTGSNAMVGYENLTMSNITEEVYFEALKEQFKNITTMTVDFPDEYEKITLGESEFKKAVCVTTAYGTSLTQVYYVRKVDKYMAFIIVTIPAGYTVEEVEAMFK